MNIGQQTFNLTIPDKNQTPSNSFTFQNCIFNIHKLNPNELANESVVKQVSDCITKNIPEVTGALIKDAAFELSGDKLKLMNATREKVELYEKSTGKIVKDAGILRALGKEAFYLGKQDDAFKYFSEAFGLDEEFRDVRGKAIDLNNIGLVYQVWGKTEKALEYFEEVLRLFEELKDVRSAAVVRYNIETLRSCIKDQ
ncbi:MAG: tetratricopeptide repeat protein [Candidatus Methanoperedens sp.]|nr:tetratricopeptide repeat protein [Candidatus Methanoperedens sp.]